MKTCSDKVGLQEERQRERRAAETMGGRNHEGPYKCGQTLDKERQLQAQLRVQGVQRPRGEEAPATLISPPGVLA